MGTFGGPFCLIILTYTKEVFQMGLDMYLYAQKYVRFLEWDKEGKGNQEFDKLVELVELDELIDKKEGYISAYAKVQIGYWRKANAIHKYFVDNCADGKDDCQEVDISRETLVALKDICGQLVQSKDVEKAKELLPPQSGFFFGTTEIDEWYFSDVEFTYNLLNKILEKIPEGNYDYDFIYRASW